MTTRSTQLATAQNIADNVWTTIYTVPALHRVIVRSIIVGNQGPTTAYPWLRVITSAGPTCYLQVSSGTPGNASFEYLTWHVLNAGDQLQVHMNGTSGLNSVLASGALLDSP